VILPLPRTEKKGGKTTGAMRILLSLFQLIGQWRKGEGGKNSILPRSGPEEKGREGEEV